MIRKYIFVAALALGLATIQANVVVDETTFPDDIFRNYVMRYATDGVITNETISGVTEMRVDSLGIRDMKGIEYFTELKYLYATHCGLESLDLSKNTKLQILSCPENSLTSIDLSNCQELFYLMCSFNQLRSLKFSNNPLLRFIYCAENQLETLDLTGMNSLNFVWCYKNRLSEIILPDSPYLHTLWIMQNQIKAEQMGRIVEALPDNDNTFNTFQVYRNDEADYPEGNEITVDQVAKATAKKWTPTYYDEDSQKWLPYQGTQPESDPYDLNGDGQVDVTDVGLLIDRILGK